MNAKIATIAHVKGVGFSLFAFRVLRGTSEQMAKCPTLIFYTNPVRGIGDKN